MALHLSNGPLKTRSGLELVPRCEPSIYQLNSYLKYLATASSGPVAMPTMLDLPVCLVFSFCLHPIKGVLKSLC